ncbi:1-phosphatidylinositol phosphodiesterase [Ceratocystis lukuohia]|uniref:1-phosphatidylinositol phosphodiesterase n=1 Tax=Ceratocystis lukuohia TaxID=2019550 RepID=A0ABR4MAB9_9PEZI
MHFSLLVALSFLAFSHAGTYKNIDDLWSFDLNAEQNADWMGTITDNTLLSSLSIPGTHNSMTDKLENILMKTQNVPLAQQLTGGIRYIDITCRYRNYIIEVYHGLTDTGYSLGNVIDTLIDFLDQHPRETIILRIQRGGIFDSPETFLKTIKTYFISGPIVDDRIIQHIYWGGPGDVTAPTLREARGKIVILFAPGTFFLPSKWAGVKSIINQSPPKDSHKLRITHTTASFGAGPINIAARPSPSSGMNKFLGEYLMNDEGNCFGIVVMDFPGNLLVQQILKLNDKHRVPNLPESIDTDTVSVDDPVHGA